MLDLTTFERHRWRDSARNSWICAWLTTSPRKWSPTPDPTISEVTHNLLHSSRTRCAVFPATSTPFALYGFVCLIPYYAAECLCQTAAQSSTSSIIYLNKQHYVRRAETQKCEATRTTIRSLRAERRYDNTMLFTSRKVQTIGRPWNWLSYVVPLLVRKLLCKLSFI